MEGGAQAVLGQKYRLVTRSDFDGLVCAMLLKELDILEEIKFVHPKDMQDGKIEITDRDITTNLPYVPGVFLAFDHHESEADRLGGKLDNHILDPVAPSAARVVYNYFGGAARFPGITDELMAAVDKSDSANFTMEDILRPSGWELLNFIMDSRTGLGRFKDFRISNYQLMMELIDHCRNMPVEEILEHPDVSERSQLYFDHEARFKDQIHRRSMVHDNVIVLDLRDEEVIFAGNRFMIYALYPQCNISLHVLWGLRRQNTVFACGKSIFNRTSKTQIGNLMLEYGGGGHANAGTCQVPNERAEELLTEVIDRLVADG